MCNEKNKNKKIREAFDDIFVHEPKSLCIVTTKRDNVLQHYIAKKCETRYYEVFSNVELTSIIQVQKFASITGNYEEKLCNEEIFNFIRDMNIKEINKS